MPWSLSELVVTYPSVFVPEGAPGSGSTLVRTAAVAAVVDLVEQDTATLDVVALPVLEHFGLGRRTRLKPTRTRHDWPTGSLEEALQGLLVTPACLTQQLTRVWRVVRLPCHLVSTNR